MSDDPQTVTQVRLLGLPSVARLARFARQPGPALLLTTRERLGLFADVAIFGPHWSLEPGLSGWPDRCDKVVLTLEHALRPFPTDPGRFTLPLECGREYPRGPLFDTLIRYGYDRDAAPGFSVRGDTLLFYPDLEIDAPVRLEFLGDELETIGRSGEVLERFRITPRVEPEADGGWTTRLIEHLPGPVLLDGPELYPGEVGDSAAWLWGHLGTREVVSFGRDPLDLVETEGTVAPLPYYRGRLAKLATDVAGWLETGYSVSLLLKFERSGRYLQERVLTEADCRWLNRVECHPGSVGLLLAPGAVGGYLNEEAKEVVLTEELLYGYQGGRKLRRLTGKRVHDATQLGIGDFLIHPDHGVGRFLGLEPRKVLGVVRDYLILQYAGEGRLYLPVDQLPLLRRHPGTTDIPPRLSTLGTNEWARTRERARVSAQRLAGKLIKTYAKRQLSDGVAFPSLPDWDPLIDEGFAFEFTPDQAAAVASTLADMERPVPMDRLISGDVGFGKTEVAIRAAHRALGHGKQVMILVPTTVLARQHFETFRDRFGPLPVRVAMLSRFTPQREAWEIVAGLRSGSIDVVVGTHRLLAEGVSCRDLGLLVIDEEHRFGVGQKERLKSLRTNLDVLSLSATPIPRTLYMSLIGLRDVSQILTPPEGRKPILTILQPYDALTAREAVLSELERGGKVFYIHDRIGSIGSKARTLSQLVPEARVGVAHGQMETATLEEVMLAFEDGAYDLLLSTTIVESGLDIGGANTLVIERADRLGLAQLYQLRGRVGRREVEARAYLFYPGRLTEQAQRRLYTIAELNDLGSGHLLAERDMEIRGVGNLLGSEQHGHVSAVSLEVYTELLAEEVVRLKGEQRAEPAPSVGLDLGLDARLSPAYIPDDDDRIATYGRLAETDSLAEVSRVARELRERFGPFPSEVRAFLDLVRLRLLAVRKGVVNIQELLTDIQLSFANDQEGIDYDARKLKALPYVVEPTRYPPGFSLKKRGLAPERIPQALTEILYLCS